MRHILPAFVTCVLLFGVAYGDYGASLNAHNILAPQKFGTSSSSHSLKLNPNATKCPYIPRNLPDELPSPLPPTLAQAFSQVARMIDAQINATSLPSTVITVAYKGKPIFSYGAGEIKRGSGKVPDADTVYRIGSVSKAFPVVQLFQLVDQGKLSLDDTLQQRGLNNVTFLNLFSPRGEQPTLRNLASQMSGLPREAPCDNGFYCNNTDAEMVKHISGKTLLITPPGSYPSYSNLAYAIMGRELTPKGQTWEQYVQHTVLDPLKLGRTGFGLNSSAIPNAATGYDASGRDVGTYSIGWMMPCGGMHSTTNDLTKFAHAIMNGEMFASSRRDSLLHQLMAPVFFNAGGQTLFGTPWEMSYHNETGSLVRKKGGNVPGFTAAIAFVPELQLSMAMLWNAHTDEFSFVDRAFAKILPPFVDMLRAHDGGEPPRQPASQADFVGAFQSPMVPGELGLIVITVRNGALVLELGLYGVEMYLRVPAFGSSPMAGSTVLQMWANADAMNCMDGELLALNNEMVVFSKNFSELTIPGLFPGYRPWVRI